MEFTSSIDKETWDRFVADSPQGNVFCTSGFLDAMPVEYQLCGLTESGRPVLGAVVLRDSSAELAAPYPLTMYQGILCSVESAAMPNHKRTKWLLDTVSVLLSELEVRAKRISFCLSHACEDLRAFQWFHYHEREKGVFAIDLRYTGVLNLQETPTFDQYLTTVRSVRRQELRKAQAAGFRTAPEEDVELLNELHALTFERQGIEREPREEQMLRSIVRAAVDNQFGQLRVCRDPKGNAVSATVFLYDRRCGYYYISATDPRYRDSGCGTLLMMDNIRLCMERGLSFVDFVGINSPNRGDFKTSFNAKPVPYFVVTWDRPAK